MVNIAALPTAAELLKDETISDIRKIYKSGATDSVKEKYQKYINI